MIVLGHAIAYSILIVASAVCLVALLSMLDQWRRE